MPSRKGNNQGDGDVEGAWPKSADHGIYNYTSDEQSEGSDGEVRINDPNNSDDGGDEDNVIFDKEYINSMLSRELKDPNKILLNDDENNYTTLSINCNNEIDKLKNKAEADFPELKKIPNLDKSDLHIIYSNNDLLKSYNEIIKKLNECNTLLNRAVSRSSVSLTDRYFSDGRKLRSSSPALLRPLRTSTPDGRKSTNSINWTWGLSDQFNSTYTDYLTDYK